LKDGVEKKVYCKKKDTCKFRLTFQTHNTGPEVGITLKMGNQKKSLSQILDK
jgi:hypothetical protein